jgi:hypothetical protein
MDSFNSFIAGPSRPSQSGYQIRPAQESDPNDDSYSNSNHSSVNIVPTPNIFKKPNKKSEEFKNEKGNKSTFIFKAPNAYAITAGLFTYKLLEINYSTPRKVVFFCTMPGCKSYFSYNAVRAQISSNGINHYKDKHKIIATTNKEENTKIKSKFIIIFILN